MKKKIIMSPPGISGGSTAALIAASAVVFILLLSAGAGDTIEGIREGWKDVVPLDSILAGKFAGTWIHAALCAALAVRNYRSFRTEGQSIYVMKRVNSSSEIHVMSLAIPLIGAVIGFAAAIGLMYAYRGSYISASDFGQLTEYNTFSIWRALL